MSNIVIYTDGATSGNGKENAVGGWGWYEPETEESDWGSILKGATNQICELTAVLEACQHAEFRLNLARTLGIFPLPQVEIRSDSAYIVNCYKDKWYKSWKNNGWKNSKKEPVANKELWENIIPFFENEYYTFIKVKGHSGEEGNEMADLLACRGRDHAKKVYKHD